MKMSAVYFLQELRFNAGDNSNFILLMFLVWHQCKGKFACLECKLGMTQTAAVKFTGAGVCRK